MRRASCPSPWLLLQSPLALALTLAQMLLLLLLLLVLVMMSRRGYLALALVPVLALALALVPVRTEDSPSLALVPGAEGCPACERDGVGAPWRAGTATATTTALPGCRLLTRAPTVPAAPPPSQGEAPVGESHLLGVLGVEVGVVAGGTTEPVLPPATIATPAAASVPVLASVLVLSAVGERHRGVGTLLATPTTPTSSPPRRRLWGESP